MAGMKTHKKAHFAVMCIMIFSLFFVTSCKKQGQIREIMVMDDASHLLVYAKLQDSLEEEMTKLARVGVPIHCVFYVNFYREKSGFDVRLSQKIVRNIMKYDNVKRSVYVTTILNGQEIDASEFQDIESAKLFMFEISDIPVITLQSLDEREKYYVAIKAKIGKEQSSLLSRYILIFLPFMEEQTDWHRKAFIWKN